MPSLAEEDEGAVDDDDVGAGRPGIRFVKLLPKLEDDAADPLLPGLLFAPLPLGLDHADDDDEEEGRPLVFMAVRVLMGLESGA